MTIAIYAGRTARNFVLKYPTGLEGKEICHFYPLDEDVSKTAHYLNLELRGKKIKFKPLSDESHGIKPADEGYLNKLERLCA